MREPVEETSGAMRRRVRGAVAGREKPRKARDMVGSLEGRARPSMAMELLFAVPGDLGGGGDA